MAREKTEKSGRTDMGFAKEMEDLAIIRRKNNLAIKVPTLAEMQRLLRRTNAWPLAVEELKTKPKKEDSR